MPKRVQHNRASNLERLSKENITSILYLASQKLHSKGFYVNLDSLMNEHLFEIRRDWSFLIGETLGRHTQPYKIKNDVLIIYADHSLFAQQAELLQINVLKLINQRYRIDLKGIQIKTGSLQWQEGYIKRKDIMSQDAIMVNNQNESISTLIDQLRHLNTIK